MECIVRGAADVNGTSPAGVLYAIRRCLPHVTIGSFLPRQPFFFPCARDAARQRRATPDVLRRYFCSPAYALPTLTQRMHCSAAFAFTFPSGTAAAKPTCYYSTLTPAAFPCHAILPRYRLPVLPRLLPFFLPFLRLLLRAAYRNAITLPARTAVVVLFAHFPPDCTGLPSTATTPDDSPATTPCLLTCIFFCHLTHHCQLFCTCPLPPLSLICPYPPNLPFVPFFPYDLTCLWITVHLGIRHAHYPPTTLTGHHARTVLTAIPGLHAITWLPATCPLGFPHIVAGMPDAHLPPTLPAPPHSLLFFGTYRLPLCLWTGVGLPRERFLSCHLNTWMPAGRTPACLPAFPTPPLPTGGHTPCLQFAPYRTPIPHC